MKNDVSGSVEADYYWDKCFIIFHYYTGEIQQQQNVQIFHSRIMTDVELMRHGHSFFILFKMLSNAFLMINQNISVSRRIVSTTQSSQFFVM